MTPNGGGTDDVFVGAGNAANPGVGGYFAFNNAGDPSSGSRTPPDPSGNHGVQASMAVGNLERGHRGGGPVAGA